jgi:hypothetical protein
MSHGHGLAAPFDGVIVTCSVVVRDWPYGRELSVVAFR